MNLNEWLGAENKLGEDIWNKKYRNGDESFDDWVNRISGNNVEISNMIYKKQFLFAGRILSNRGLHKVGKKITYSNCFVLTPPEDSIESIFDTAKNIARTYSYGGGVGIDISKLRPNGSRVNNASETTSGAVSFMSLYNLTTEIIGQKGRRGALMISIDVNHPDVEDFIKIKSDLDKIKKANISIRVDDEFMSYVYKDIKGKTQTEVSKQFLIECTGEIIDYVMCPSRIFRKLIETNWDFAEPGILFWDKIKEWNIVSEDENFEYAGTNPCAEEPLPAGGSCLLGSLILPTFVENKKFKMKEFKQAVASAVIGLNEVLDEGIPLLPLKEQIEAATNWRQIGLGILGVGDMFIKLEIKYGSEESLKISNDIGRIWINEALKVSALLAKKYGTYPLYNEEAILSSPFIIQNTDVETIELIKKYGLRNSQLLTIAPTGLTKMAQYKIH